jgi:hypothetical protein
LISISNIDDWDAWKDTLGKAIDISEDVGISKNTVNKVAEKVGTFLANNVDPRNNEERLLKELWNVADSADREMLAKLVVRMVDMD